MCALTVDPTQLPPGVVVVVQDDNSRWIARLIDHCHNPDGKPTGLSDVEVIDQRQSYWRPGLVVAAVTARLRRVVDSYPADCHCQWQYLTGQGDWAILAPVSGCPHHGADAADGGPPAQPR